MRKRFPLLLKEQGTELVSLSEHKEYALTLMGVLEGTFVWANHFYLITQVVTANQQGLYMLWCINRRVTILTTPVLVFLDSSRSVATLLKKLDRWRDFARRKQIEWGLTTDV